MSMANPSLRDFDGIGNDIELDGYIGLIDEMSEHLNDKQISQLWGILAGRGEEGRVEYNASFDIGKEISQQIMAVRALRNSVMPGGKVRPGLAAREVKETITASATLLNTLLKTHEKVMSFDRSRAIEEAVTETVRTLPDEQQKVFFALLEENLSAIE